MSNPDYFVNQLCGISNTMGLPCTAQHAVLLHSESQLPELSVLAAQFEKVRVIGCASNLILPATLEGLTVLVRSRGVNLLGQTEQYRFVEVCAGEIWHDWVTYALDQGWHGMENLALIPGTVGAAPVQNIGAYGVEVERLIDSVKVWDFSRGEMYWLDRQSCQFEYRDSVFKQQQSSRLMILAVRFALPLDWRPVLDYPDLAQLAQARSQAAEVTPRQVFEAVVDIRSRKLPDPGIVPNSGSFFKNPVISSDIYDQLKRRYPELVAYPQKHGGFKLAAGWLIDQCGWKGRQVGTVRVHDRQALVLTNAGHATQEDVLDVAKRIMADVLAKFNVSLEIEPVCWDS